MCVSTYMYITLSEIGTSFRVFFSWFLKKCVHGSMFSSMVCQSTCLYQVPEICRMGSFSWWAWPIIHLHRMKSVWGMLVWAVTVVWKKAGLNWYLRRTTRDIAAVVSCKAGCRGKCLQPQDPGRLQAWGHSGLFLYKWIKWQPVYAPFLGSGI